MHRRIINIVTGQETIIELTEEEIAQLVEAENNRVQSLTYIEKRKPEYPLISDQLDMIWHAINQEKLDKTSDFYLALKSVKDTYPKIIIPTQPYPSWVLNTNTWLWEPPTPMPDDGNNYQWNEDTQNWTLVENIV
jgi:hypothetical protein